MSTPNEFQAVDDQLSVAGRGGNLPPRPAFIAVAYQGDPRHGTTPIWTLSREPIAELALRWNGNDEVARPGSPTWSHLIQHVIELARDPTTEVVVEDAATTTRTLRYRHGIPHPASVWCLREGAAGTWPGRWADPDLLTVARDLLLTPRQEVAQVAHRRLAIMEAVYQQQMRILPHQEQALCRHTQAQRGWSLSADGAQATTLLVTLRQIWDETMTALMRITVMDQHLEPADLRRINRGAAWGEFDPAALLAWLNPRLGEALTGTDPDKLPASVWELHPEAAQMVVLAHRLDKIARHRSWCTAITPGQPIEVDLAYFGAGTGRFTSPIKVPGAICLHSLPKHDLTIAKPLRQVLRAPEGFCFVRGDLANVEYRIAGQITGCETICRMFDPARGGDPLADPYRALWRAMTGQEITKSDPRRQLAKAAVLGLTFEMTEWGFIHHLRSILAQAQVDLTPDLLTEMGADEVDLREVRRMMESGLHTEELVRGALALHARFRRAHPELHSAARFILERIGDAILLGTAIRRRQDVLDNPPDTGTAPRPPGIRLVADPEDFSGCTIKVQVGDWCPTMAWRNLRHVSAGMYHHEIQFTRRDGTSKVLNEQLALNNVVQAGGRNALGCGLLMLQERGFRQVLHVHDEIQVLVRKTPDAVLAARQALLEIFGPNGCHPQGWAAVMRPEEITVTESLYEDPADLRPRESSVHLIGDRWARIAAGTADCLSGLP